MSTTPEPTELTRPPSLKDFLDQGGDLVALDGTDIWLEGLVESLYMHYMLVPQRKREERAAFSRYSAEEMLRTGEGTVPFTDGRHKDPDPEGLQRIATTELWEAELYEDEELQERFKAAVPRILIETYEQRYQKARRPYPLEVRVPEWWWSCVHCGAMFEEGTTEAVVVGSQEGWSDTNFEEDLYTYCRDCISMVAETFKVKV